MPFSVLNLTDYTISVQALFYHLRTSKEDFTQHHRTQTQARRMAEARRIQQLRQQQQQAHQNQQQQQSHIASPVQQPDRIVEMEVDPQERPKPTEAPVVKQEASEVKSAPSGDASESRTPVTASADDSSATAAVKPETAISATDSPANANATPQMPSSIPHVNGNVQQNTQSQSGTNPAVLANVQAVMQMSRQPQELLEEILNILKTAFPLLALSMEKMVDHINVRTKPPIEEDCYRFLSALLNEAIATWTNKGKYKDDNELIPAHIRDKVRAFCAQTKHDLRQVMYDQFVSQPITLREYIIRLQRWQERYEKALDARPKREQLDHGDCLLSDFHHSKFDDVEIPGQYIEHVDNNSGFAKITRFAPTMEVARGFCYYFRRITILGTNGRSHTFAVQSPSGRHCRREERLTQLFRILNTVLQKRKESRKRNLSIHLPAAIPLTPTLRLVTSDNSYVSLQDVFDEHCRRMDMGRDKPTLEFIDKWRQIYVPSEVSQTCRIDAVTGDRLYRHFDRLPIEISIPSSTRSREWN
jgi:transformation/transcription domain-associated protein